MRFGKGILSLATAATLSLGVTGCSKPYFKLGSQELSMHANRPAMSELLKHLEIVAGNEKPGFYQKKQHGNLTRVDMITGNIAYAGVHDLDNPSEDRDGQRGTVKVWTMIYSQDGSQIAQTAMNFEVYAEFDEHLNIQKGSVKPLSPLKIEIGNPAKLQQSKSLEANAINELCNGIQFNDCLHEFGGDKLFF